MMYNPPEFILKMIEDHPEQFEQLEILRTRHRSLKRIPNGVFIRKFPRYYHDFLAYKNPTSGLTREEKSIQILLNSDD